MARTVEGLAELYDQIGMSEIGDSLRATAALSRKLNGPEEFGTVARIEAAVILTPADQDRQLREAMHPYVLEYKAAKVLTPDLINATWQGIWKVAGESAGYAYQVPKCDRTAEQLAELKQANRAALLLPDDIYTLGGLVRLGRIFPLMKSWVTMPEEAIRISHSSNQGGCIDVEMSLDAPYRTFEGYNEQQLRDKIAADGRNGIRLPTYLVAGQFSKLLTGHYLDENTWSRTPGSFCGSQALYASFYSYGKADVSGWIPGLRYSDLGGRSEGAKRA